MIEYLLMVLWIVVIGVEVYFNYRKMNIKKEYMRHWIWFIPRLVVGLIFLFSWTYLGYYWYWAGLYLIGTHMLLFPEALNYFRGKGAGYLGDINHTGKHKSIYDYLLQQVIKSPAAVMCWIGFRLILFLFAVGNMIMQGKCSWYELNHGLCL